MINEKPILMSAPMVQAILRKINPKTQTRRIVNMAKLKVYLPAVVKSDAILCLMKDFKPMSAQGLCTAKIAKFGAVSVQCKDGQWLGVKPGEFDFKCPYADGETHLGNYGKETKWTIIPKSSRLWVKETFARLHDGLLQHLDPDPDNGDPYNNGWSTAFRSDGDPANWKHYGQHWKPSIFMPRKLSRITLQIISVRVERLQDISESDAKAEGYPGGGNGGINVDCSPFVWYRKLWESINGKGSWSLNPWVWRVEFKRTIP